MIKQRLKARFVGVHRTGSMPGSLPPRAAKRLALSRCTKACRACLNRALHSRGLGASQEFSVERDGVRMAKSKLQHQPASYWASSGNRIDIIW